MTDDLERRLRVGLSGAALPVAPDSLHEALDLLPDEAGSIGTGGHGLRMAWAMPVLVVIVVIALIAAWLPGGILGPAAPTASPRGSPSQSAGVPSPSSTLATGPEVDDFGLFDAQHGWAESNGHLFLTADDGATWADQGPIGSDYYATVTFASPDVAFAQSGPLFERTTDAGRTWEPVVLPTHAGTFASFSFLSPTNGYLLMSASGNGPGTLLSTTDTGLTWTVVAEVGAAVVGGIRFIDARDGWAVGTHEPYPPTGRPTLDALFATRDGGHSWQETTLPVPTGYEAADLQEVSGLPSPAGDGAYVLSAEYLSTARLAWVTEYLVTTDGGATWQAVGRLPGQDNGPLVPFDTQRWLAFLATPDGSSSTFYTTSDAGGTWSPMSPTGLPPGFSVGYALRFADRQHGWAIVDGVTRDIGSNIDVSQQLYGTSDGGQTWHLLFGSQSASPSSSPTTATSPSPVDLAGIFPGGGLWAVEGSTLLLSTDAGSSWRRTTVPTSTGFIPTAFSPSVFVLDRQHAWSLTIGPGSTANTGSSTDVLNLIVNRTSDGGLTWQASAVPANLANTSPAVVFADPLHGYLVGSAQRQSDGTSTVASTDDGGATWSVVATRPWLGAMVTVSDASTIWAGGQQEAGGQFLQPILDVSRDGGHTWQDARLPGLAGEDESQCGCYLAGPPLFVDPAIGYVTVISNATGGTSVTSIDRTTDGGRSWTVVTSKRLETAAGVAVLDSLHWLLPVGYPTDVFGTANAGASWQTVAPAGSPSEQVTWIAGLDTDHAAALRLITSSAPSFLALYLSADGGATWQPADLGTASASSTPAPSATGPTPSESPGATATSLAFFDAQAGLLVGTDVAGNGGLWRTTDGGRTWSAPIALPLAQPTSVAVWGTQDAWVGTDCGGTVTSTCEPGVFGSSDGGRTWQRTSSTAVTSLSFADAIHGWATMMGGPAVGGAAGGLLASADGGRTWSSRGNPCPAGGWPAGISFPSAQDGWVGCTGMSGGGTAAKWVMGTTNGGASWTVRSGVPEPGSGPSVGTIDFGDTLAGLAIRPDGVGIWWGARGETERTADGGRSWSVGQPGSFDVVIPVSLSLPTEADWFVLAWDSNGGREVIEASHDGGRTWAAV